MIRGYSFSPDGMQSFPCSVGGGKLAYGDWDELCNVVSYSYAVLALLHLAFIK